MINVVWLFIATVAVDVAGSRLETTEGHNVTIPFNTGLERVDEVKIIFQGESKRKRLLAQYCSPESFPICDPVETSHLQVEGGNVSFILVNVDISRSGLYTAQAITANKVYEVTATLVVNQAPVSSSPAPPPSSSSPKPPRSSDLLWLYAVITAFFIIIIIMVFCCFCRWRKILCFKREKELENRSSDGVAVAFKGCGENPEALLKNTRVPQHKSRTEQKKSTFVQNAVTFDNLMQSPHNLIQMQLTCSPSK